MYAFIIKRDSDGKYLASYRNEYEPDRWRKNPKHAWILATQIKARNNMRDGESLVGVELIQRVEIVSIHEFPSGEGA